MAEELPLLTSSPISSGPEPSRGVAAVAVRAVAGVAIAAALATAVYFISLPSKSKTPALSADALAYASQLAISDLHMSEEENYLNQDTILLNGKVTNNGAKTVRSLQVLVFFRDSMNQVILRDEGWLVRRQLAALSPGQTQEFELRFDRVPNSWNFQLPQLQIETMELE